MRMQSLVSLAFAIAVATSASAQLGPETSQRVGNLGTFDLTDFGAVCDGRHDDTRAIQTWLSKLKPYVRLTAPAGVCVFSAPLKAPRADNWTIEGSGSYSTVFNYIGSVNDIDLLTIGNTDGGAGFKGGYLANFKIASQTKMAGGAALHVHGSFGTMFRNLVMGGFGGNGNLNDGFWFDGVGHTTLIGYDAKGRGDGIRVNQALGGAADLYLFSGRVGQFAIGLHVAGGVGGSNAISRTFSAMGYQYR